MISLFYNDLLLIPNKSASQYAQTLNFIDNNDSIWFVLLLIEKMWSQELDKLMHETWILQ